MKKRGIYWIFILLILMFITPFTIVNAQENKHLTNSKSQTKEEQLVNTKKHLAELLKQQTGLIRLMTGNNDYNTVYNLGYPKEILVFDDRIEFIYTDNKNVITQTIKLYYSYILEEKIKVKVITSNSDNGSQITENHLKLGNVSIVMTMENAAIMKLLANDLTIIQNKLNEERFKMEEFEKIAAEYCTFKVASTITEEQRKYIIQANSFALIMQYDNAINQYVKVLALDQTSYPEAYYNLALLLAQTNRYYAAINFMKKYLLLISNAADAQNAKNKIKDWEIMLQY